MDDSQPPPFPISISHNPPYYAVIFTATRHPKPNDGYSKTDARMEELAREQAGFLAFEWVTMPSQSAKGEVRSISISYWTDEASIRAWKRLLEHREAQMKGKNEWYDRFELRVCRLERAYGFTRKANL